MGKLGARNSSPSNYDEKNRAGGNRSTLLTHHCWIHVFFEIGFAQSTIPIVGDVPTVHDLTEQIPKIFPYDVKGMCCDGANKDGVNVHGTFELASR